MIAKDKLTVFVGDIDDELATSAKLHDSAAYLVDFANYNKQHTGTCYTSIADLPGLVEFSAILRQASTIIYVQPEKWNNNETNKYSSKYWTEYYLNVFSLDKTKEVINFSESIKYQPTNLSIMLNLLDSRKDELSQILWVAGCSVTYGVGVTTEQRYGNLLAKQLNLPLRTLGRESSSISYAADQILRSDIKQGDTVVWGITNQLRITYYDPANLELTHITTSNYIKDRALDKIIKLDFLDNPTLIYSAVIAIYQVINFCQKIGAKLLLAGLLVEPKLAAYFINLPEYIHLYNFYGVTSSTLFLDTGSDNIHPGPLTHQWYADKILNKLKELE